MKPNWSALCKAYRARKAAAGLCIAGCGRKSTRASGLCETCRKKYNKRNVENQRKRRKATKALTS